MYSSERVVVKKNENISFAQTGRGDIIGGFVALNIICQLT